MPQRLVIKTFALGQWRTNCYVIHNVAPKIHDPCWIVDAGFDPEALLEYVRKRQLDPRHVLLTHGHLDHIAGLNRLRQIWPELSILIHPAEKDFLTDPALNLSELIAEPVVVAPATGMLEHGQTLSLEGWDFVIRHTPGHSPGGVALYQADTGVALVGDTLFAGSIGRYDFPGSAGATLLQSIREQLLTLPDSTRVLPGHGPATTVGQERVHNPYLQNQ